MLMKDTKQTRRASSNRRQVLPLLLLLALSGGAAVHGFGVSVSVPGRPFVGPSLSSEARAPCFRHRPSATIKRTAGRTTKRTTTALPALLDVPEGFFTVTFVSLGIFLSVSKQFGRVRMEENAWEGRLAEARRAKVAADPTLTELDVRRQEAALEWSAYGQPRQQQQQEQGQFRETETSTGRRGRRVQVMDREDTQGRVYDNDDEDDDNNDEEDDNQTSRGMTDAEITAFELEYAIKYDPYYDEPYDESELPNDMKCTIDRRYGDRIYENGEIFYKDPETGLFYRQGAKPRNLKFWT